MVRVRASQRWRVVVGLAFISALQLEFSQQSFAHVRCVVDSTVESLLRLVLYFFVAKWRAGAKIRVFARTQYVCASFVLRLYDLWPGGVILWGPNDGAYAPSHAGRATP